MNHVVTTFFFTVGVTSSFGASPATFICEVSPSAKEHFGILVGNAGCFVYERGRVLMIENLTRKGVLTPPGGTSEGGESAQCTAARKTFEETSTNVVVQELLHNFEDKFYLFRCELKGQTLADFQTPRLNGEGTSRATSLDISKSSPEKWRFPKQFYVLKGIFLYFSKP